MVGGFANKATIAGKTTITAEVRAGEQAAIRDRVLANISESKQARVESGFATASRGWTIRENVVSNIAESEAARGASGFAAASRSWTSGERTYYHAASNPATVDLIKNNGFRTDIPSPQAAWHNNRYGRGVYLGDTPATVAAERPGGTMMKVKANVGNNLNLTSRGVIGRSDYDMTHAIGRGARKHGYDSITFESAKLKGGVNTVIFDPKKVRVIE